MLWFMGFSMWGSGGGGDSCEITKPLMNLNIINMIQLCSKINVQCRLIIFRGHIRAYKGTCKTFSG